MPAVDLKLENKLLSTFVAILELKIGEQITLSLSDGDFVLERKQ